MIQGLQVTVNISSPYGRCHRGGAWRKTKIWWINLSDRGKIKLNPIVLFNIRGGLCGPPIYRWPGKARSVVLITFGWTAYRGASYQVVTNTSKTSMSIWKFFTHTSHNKTTHIPLSKMSWINLPIKCVSSWEIVIPSLVEQTPIIHQAMVNQYPIPNGTISKYTTRLVGIKYLIIKVEVHVATTCSVADQGLVFPDWFHTTLYKRVLVNIIEQMIKAHILRCMFFHKYLIRR